MINPVNHFMSSKQKIHIGTSGYSYSHWQDVFYPASLSESKWLEYYVKYFKTVELNITFYRLPQEKIFKSWYKRTPKDFVFAVKGSRFISHIKKLKDVAEPLKLFFSRLKYLKKKTCVVLWQLPPAWKLNLKRLEEFLKMQKRYKIRQAFEFRNKTWFCPEVYQLLKKYNAALCIADSPDWPEVEEATADFIYIRLHGGKILYGSNYSAAELKEWAKKIKKWTKNRKNVYVYFNNDFEGYAVKNALELKEILKIKN